MIKTSKTLVLTMAAITLTAFLTACGGSSGIPNGTYKPVDPIMASIIPSIKISGDEFTLRSFTGSEETVKYKYEDGKVIFSDGDESSSLCEYKDGSLWFAGDEFKRS